MSLGALWYLNRQAPGAPPALPAAVFLVRRGHQALTAELGLSSLGQFPGTSAQEHLGTVGCGKGGGWGGDRGWGQTRGVLERLVKTGIIIHGCNNLTLGS